MTHSINETENTTSLINSSADEAQNVPDTYLDELNDDCLILIFDLLKEIDWIRLCEYNQRFRSLIQHHVITRKLFDFGSLQDNTNAINVKVIFESFGKNFRKIKITENDIDMQDPHHTGFGQFLRLLKMYCIPDKIVHLDIAFAINLNQRDKQLLAQVISQLTNIAHLRVYFGGGERAVVKEFLNMLSLKNVQSLEFNGLIRIEIDFDWLRTATSPGNLRHLNFGYAVRIENSAESSAFFEWQPNIKTFQCRNDQFLTFLKPIATHLPNIETISYIQVKDCDQTTNWVITDCLPALKTFLPKLTKLKSLEVKAVGEDGHDLYEILDCVCKTNVIRTLFIWFWPNLLIPGRFDVERKITNFAHLTQLCVRMPSAPYAVQVFDEFIRIGLPQMTNVKHMTVYNERMNEQQLLDIVRSMGQLCVLEIRLGFIHFSQRIYRNLLKARMGIQDHTQRKAMTIVIHCVEDINDYCTMRFGSVYDEHIVKFIKFEE